MNLSNQKYSEWMNRSSFSNYITFFTPTYNRSDFLNRVYDCLLNQTDKRFVWIVVNDGSIDNTDCVMRELLDKNDFPILYITKSNGGKHSAFEHALRECITEFFMCMDDDDIYSLEAVQTFFNEWDRIKDECKLGVIGAVRTLTQENDGTVVSQKSFNKSLIGSRKDQTTLESNYVHNEFLENWTCYRTEALRSIDLFPKNYWMHNQHKFFSESIWQGRFARKYMCRYLYVILREYRHDTPTSIIRSAKSRQHYVDMFINTKMILDEQFDFIKKSPKLFLKNLAIISILRHKLAIPISELLRNTQSVFLRICYVILAPFSCLARKPIIQC